MRLLVVDDDVVVVMGFQMSFDDVEVVECGSVGGALRLAADEPWDGVVVDRRLVDGDGLDLVRRLRCRHGTRRVPIAVITAGYDAADEPLVLRAGADIYLQKPCEPTFVRAVLDDLAATPPDHRSRRRRRMLDVLDAGSAVPQVLDLRPPAVGWRDAVIRPPARTARFWRRHEGAVAPRS